MRIGFFCPFRPLDHPRVSGDVTIARDLVEYFVSRGHDVVPASRLQCEWIYRRPGRWPVALAAAAKARKRGAGLDCWLSCQTFYRAPDLLGPSFGRTGKPYFIFSGTYATKRRRRLSTWAGYHLNRRALLRADFIFSNKKEKMDGLKRIIPPSRLGYVRPGIKTEAFAPAPAAGRALRRRLGAENLPLAATTAMFRPGVKTEGVAFVIEACARLAGRGRPVGLIIIGDGPERGRLERLAKEKLPGKVYFLGELSRSEMSTAYGAGDVFAFPGIDENLGMVYLEAQCCGLPVVASDHGGAPEVAVDGQTGIISPAFDLDRFAEAIDSLISDPARREAMSRAARSHVLTNHDLFKNYRAMEEKMVELVGRRG